LYDFKYSLGFCYWYHYFPLLCFLSSSGMVIWCWSSLHSMMVTSCVDYTIWIFSSFALTFVHCLGDSNLVSTEELLGITIIMLYLTFHCSCNCWICLSILTSHFDLDANGSSLKSLAVGYSDWLQQLSINISYESKSNWFLLDIQYIIDFTSLVYLLDLDPSIGYPKDFK